MAPAEITAIRRRTLTTLSSCISCMKSFAGLNYLISSAFDQGAPIRGKRSVRSEGPFVTYENASIVFETTSH